MADFLHERFLGGTLHLAARTVTSRHADAHVRAGGDRRRSPVYTQRPLLAGVSTAPPLSMP